MVAPGFVRGSESLHDDDEGDDLPLLLLLLLLPLLLVRLGAAGFLRTRFGFLSMDFSRLLILSLIKTLRPSSVDGERQESWRVIKIKARGCRWWSARVLYWWVVQRQNARG